MSRVISKIIDFDNLDQAMNIFGELDKNAKEIEAKIGINITNRGQNVLITGEASKVYKASGIFDKLIEMSRSGECIGEQNVLYLINIVEEQQIDVLKNVSNDVVAITSRGVAIRSKTMGQKKYIKSIENNTIVFCIGPAGTGKTFLAVAMAVKAFREKKVSRIILTRPAVEAGERLGFLPGDLQNKVDPYLRPLYDSLYQIMGPETFASNMEKGIIEVAPLAYMRGRTLDDSFIILDEAQNTTQEQMKMFLTRIGMGSKAIITGDITQIDLARDKKSGLVVVQKILKSVKDLEFIYLTYKDVVRHKLVQKIIKAYEEYEIKRNKT